MHLELGYVVEEHVYVVDAIVKDLFTRVLGGYQKMLVLSDVVLVIT